MCCCGTVTSSRRCSLAKSSRLHVAFHNNRNPLQRTNIKGVRLGRRARVHAAAGTPTPHCGVILEVDGALVDLHIDGHRVAFNNAFKSLGLDCSNWTAPVYNDVMSQGDGTGEGMVRSYFARVGWPAFLPTSEQDVFAVKVHELKQKEFEKLIKDRKVTPRQGVDKVLLDALESGAQLAGISETLSQPSDDVCGCIQEQLPLQVVNNMRIYPSGLHIGPSDGTSSTGSDGEPEAGFSMEGFTAASAKLKQQGAQEFVAALQQQMKGLKTSGVDVTLDPGLMSAGMQPILSAGWLSAVAATLGVPSSSCLVLASSGGLIRAAAQAGMVPVAIPRGAAFAASYVEARAKFEGYGPGYATWPRLQSLLQQPRMEA